MLGANARFHFETEYDGKGNGLTRLAGHMPVVGEREAICNTPRLRPAGGDNVMCTDQLYQKSLSDVHRL